MYARGRKFARVYKLLWGTYIAASRDSKPFVSVCINWKAPFVWTEEHLKSFQALKKALLSAEMLAMPQREGVFILDMDASDVAVGRQLSQVQGDKIRPIAFASKRLTPSQGKDCTTCKELLALITFTHQFRHYLLGRHFLPRMDHSSLDWLMRFKDIEGQLARWLEELAQFDTQIVLMKGKEHANADALSRLPDDILRCDCWAGSEVASLLCGGCKYCSRERQQWVCFEDDVDDNLTGSSASKSRIGRRTKD